MITTDNYEGYLMRYADGELDDNEVAMVESFLDAHPDLREELDAITDPSLKITPPLVTMPSKEKMLQPVAAACNSSRYIWYSIAAALALLLAFGIVLQMGRHNENPIIAQNGEIHPITVTDSPLPDSLYIGRGKPAPVFLANTQKIKTVNRTSETMSLDDNEAFEEQSVETIVSPLDEVCEPMIAQNETVDDGDTPVESTFRKHGNVIVIETDQLVTLTPKPEERKDIRVGNVIENNNIALSEKKSPLGQAFDAVTRFILRRTDTTDVPLLAFSE